MSALTHQAEGRLASRPQRSDGLQPNINHMKHKKKKHKIVSTQTKTKPALAIAGAADFQLPHMDNDVAMPKRVGRESIWDPFLAAMNVGDSFRIRKQQVPNLRVRAKQTGVKIAVRLENGEPDYFRVWRMED